MKLRNQGIIKTFFVTFLVVVAVLQGIPGTQLKWYDKSMAKDYTNGGCVSWVKDRAKEIGITLPATGQNKYGLYGASAYWTNLTGYSKGSEPAQYALAVWEFNSSADSTYRKYGHVAFVESVNGDNVTVTEGGCSGYSYNGHTGVINRTVSRSKMATLGGCSGFYGYIYLKGSAPVVNLPQGCVDRISGGLGHINVDGWSFDKDSTSTALAIHVYIGGPAGSGAECHAITANKLREDVNNVYGCGNYHGFSDDIYTGCYGSQPVYVYAINIGSGNHNPLLGSGTVNITKDSTNPVIKDVKIINRNSSGYTVQCTVTDNDKVSSVKFPTWTLENDQDDIIWGEGSANGNVYTYQVKISDHKGEHGLYRTHIYAYDPSGNVSATAVSQKDSPVDTSVVVPTDYTPATVGIYEEHIYAVFDESVGYDKSKTICQNFGGHLASIESENEYKAVNEILSNGGLREHYYMDSEWASSGSAGLSNNWSVAGFVLEIDDTLQPVNSGKLGNVTYEVYDTNIPFWVAKAYCDIHGGQLADINSQEVNDYVKELISVGKCDNYYIGLFKYNDKWFDMSAKEPTYLNWGQGEPNNDSGIQDCGVMVKKTGKFDDHFAYCGSIGFVMQKMDEKVEDNEVSDELVTVVSGDHKENKIGEKEKSYSGIKGSSVISIDKPGQVYWNSVKNVKKKKIKLSWFVQTEAYGYQIQYARNKKFTYQKKSRITKNTAATINGLKKKKIYYFRVRAYKIIGGKKVYGKWSKVKKIKVKK